MDVRKARSTGSPTATQSEITNDQPRRPTLRFGRPRPAVQESAASDEERGSDHVDISPERDYMLSQRPAGGPWAGSETSWRNTPQSTVTIQVLSGVLLVCLGLLLGTSWTVQALQSNLRRQAEERRRLNEEWSAVRTARRQRGECPTCKSPLLEGNWYIGPTIMENPPDDD